MTLVALGTALVLASASPRRRELLAPYGFDLVVRPADVDESILPGEDPLAYVARVARAKAAAVAHPGEIVLAADTTVDLDGTILVKPVDDADARRILKALSGATHLVHTAVAIAAEGRIETVTVTTAVTFADLTAETIDWYVATGEPHDKAGAYAIQGAGAALVAHVDGSVSNVIGLPLAETLSLLRSVAGR